MINIDKKWKRELLDDLTKSLIEHRITAFRFTQCERNPLLAREIYDPNIIIHVAHMGDDTPYVLNFKRKIVQNPENREIVRNHPTLLHHPIVLCA